MGTQFVAPLGVSIIRTPNDGGGEDCTVHLNIPILNSTGDANTGSVVERIEKRIDSPGCDLAQVSNDLEDHIQQNTPNLGTKLEAALPPPVVPTLKMLNQSLKMLLHHGTRTVREMRAFPITSWNQNGSRNEGVSAP
jgi:hypothetical protein